MRARKGPQQAIVTTAHKIARIVYHLLKTGEVYIEQSASEFEEQRHEGELRQPLDLELPERKIELDGEGRVVSVAFKERLDAHKLIEEFGPNTLAFYKLV